MSLWSRGQVAGCPARDARRRYIAARGGRPLTDTRRDMDSGRLSCVLLLLLVVRWSGEGGEAAPAPLFGLGSALAGSLFGSIATSSNSTSLLEVLAAQHLQSKLDALTALAEALGLSGNVTASATVTG